MTLDHSQRMSKNVERVYVACEAITVRNEDARMLTADYERCLVM